MAMAVLVYVVLVLAHRLVEVAAEDTTVTTDAPTAKNSGVDFDVSDRP